MVQTRKPKTNAKAEAEQVEPPQSPPLKAPRTKAPARRPRQKGSPDEENRNENVPATPKKRVMAEEHSSGEQVPVESPKTPKRPRIADTATPKLPVNFQKTLDNRRTPKIDYDKANKERLSRAKTERMVILDHNISEAPWGPVITFRIVGSVGNIYTTVIKAFPSCDCPDFTYRRARCKHMLYALVNALSVKEEVVLQKSFSEADLAQMLESSALTRVDRAVAHATPGTQADPSTRKPIEGECAICFMEMKQSENIVWCESRCGNNLHELCFKQWAATCGGTVNCVYCRAPWGEQDPETLVESIIAAGVPSGQYVNVADQFGMSSRRDYSIYRTPRAPRGSRGKPKGLDDDPPS